MLSLTDRDAVTAALTDPTLDPALRALIALRVWQVDTDRRRPLGEVLQIVVVQPRDPPELIHPAVGFQAVDQLRRLLRARAVSSNGHGRGLGCRGSKFI